MTAARTIPFDPFALKPTQMKVLGFWRPFEMNGFLGQWFPSSFQDETGMTFDNAEQYMMYQKAKIFGDDEIAKQIMTTNKPQVMKSLGQRVRNFDQKVWDQQKYQIVVNGTFFKFSQNPALKEQLLATGDSYLAEASPYDKIWGVGTTSLNPRYWQGQNLLGCALMAVRYHLVHDQPVNEPEANGEKAKL